MSYLNVTYNLLISEDQSQSNPLIRDPDIQRNYRAIVDYEGSNKYILQPGDITVISSTLRTTTIQASTQFQITRPVSTDSTVRLTWTGTGTAPTFRTARNTSIDSSSIFSITRTGPNTARLQTTPGNGTPMNTAAVQPGDILIFNRNTDTFTNDFSLANIGSWVVQAKGSGYVDYIDNGIAALDTDIAVNANYLTDFVIMSPGPVKVGDNIDIESSQFSVANQGIYQVTAVNPNWVEYVNPYAVLETVTNTDNAIILFDHLNGFLNVRASGPFQFNTNTSTNWVDVGMLGQEAFFMGSVSGYQITARNNSQQPIIIKVVEAAYVGPC